MLENLPENDLWTVLATEHRPIVMYGMGNGADKILRICDDKGIIVSDFFASDGFVRGHSFHGKRVFSYSEVREKYGDGNFIILVAFATRIDEVMERIREMSRQNTLYIPDVPVYGDTLFDLAYFKSHRDALETAMSFFEDEESRQVFSSVIEYRLTGKIKPLDAHITTPDEVFATLLHPNRYRISADFGAYNGDTIRELLRYCGNLQQVFAFEPDRRNYRKLSEYASEEERVKITPVPACAWDTAETLTFDASGNRNANAVTGTNKAVDVQALPPDDAIGDAQVDYMKYDVEGAEARALQGSRETIFRCRPELLISLYHRSEDIYSIPLYIKQAYPDYRLYLRRFPYYPAWDLNLYCIK